MFKKSLIYYNILVDLFSIKYNRKKMLNEIYEESIQLLSDKKIPNRHTFFQLKHFVLGKELTTQSKMQKCLKELEARIESIKAMILSMEETQDDIKIIDLKIKNLEKKKEKNSINKEYKEIHIRKFNRKKIALINSLENINKKLIETEEECKFFLEAFKQLEKVEPLKYYDDKESNENFWNENFSQELQLRVLLQKPLDLELIKSILALNKEAPVRLELIKILDQIQKSTLIENKNDKNIECR
jgi:hypothetical protein